MRRRGLLPLLGITDFPHQDRLAGRECLVTDVENAPRILHALDVGADDVGMRIADEIVNEVQRRYADLVAGGHHLAERQTAVERRQIHHRKAETAGLRHHAHRAAVVIGIKHRAETGIHRVGRIDHALAVGADDADVVFARNVRQLLLHRHAVAAGLGKARAKNDHIRHALFAAGGEHVGDARGINQDQRQLRHFRQRLQRGPAFDADDFLILRIDRIQLALVAVAGQVFQRLAADGDQILRGADDGDGFGAEKTLDVSTHERPDLCFVLRERRRLYAAA